MSTPRKKKIATDEPSPVNQGRHEAQCTICNHAKREEIDQAFVNWSSSDRISR